MEDYVTRIEYEEYKLRMQSEHEHMHKVLVQLEESSRQHGELLITIQGMSITQSGMLEEQRRQSARIEALEAKDGKMWRRVAEHAVTVAVGAFLCYIFTSAGL